MSSMEQQWMPDAGSTFEPGNGSFTGHIFDAEWATDAGYLAGSVLRLLWKIKVSEPLDWSAFDGTDVFNCWWTIGAGWETHDGGRTVVNTDDTPALLKGFRNNTLYSRILGWAAKAQLKERINEAGGPRVAAAWTGLSLRFEPDTYEVGTREERTTRTRGFPTAVVDNQMRLPEAPTGQTAQVLASLPPAMLNALTDAARAGTYQQFVDTGMDLAAEYDMLGNNALIQALSDDGLYKELQPI